MGSHLYKDIIFYVLIWNFGATIRVFQMLNAQSRTISNLENSMNENINKNHLNLRH
jgi:hypothetical protein